MREIVASSISRDPGRTADSRAPAARLARSRYRKAARRSPGRCRHGPNGFGCQRHRRGGLRLKKRAGRRDACGTITVKPGQRLSYQRHQRRAERWFIVAGEGIVTLDGIEHKVQAVGEDDIERLADDYGRAG
ncbi:hypothetical protein AB0H49_26680 [Nocardia sp. NPDC050713]|uniref:hypothetical protein n=1 Tax=Nocardia sp. NPDC050713 TaxID=3154511 RepID=UPI0033CAEAC4